MADVTPVPPPQGKKITISRGKLNVPDNRSFRSSKATAPAAISGAQPCACSMPRSQKSYGGKRKIQWMEIYAGEKSFNMSGTWLPDATVRGVPRLPRVDQRPADDAGRRRHPLAERRVAADARSVRVPAAGALVQRRAFAGQEPENVDMVIFRENTEDIYAGIEFEAGSADNRRISWSFSSSCSRRNSAKIRFPGLVRHRRQAGLAGGHGPARPRRARIRDREQAQEPHDRAQGQHHEVHRGRLPQVGYEVAEREFGEHVYTWLQWDKTKAAKGEDAANAEQSAALEDGSCWSRTRSRTSRCSRC